MVAYGICLSLTSLNMIISKSFHGYFAMALFHSFLYLSNSSLLCVYTCDLFYPLSETQNFDDISLSEFPFWCLFLITLIERKLFSIVYHNSDFFCYWGLFNLDIKNYLLTYLNALYLRFLLPSHIKT